MQKGFILSLIFVILSGIALGQVPQLINYQGVLIEPATGQPVPDDTYSITFSIYDVASGGSAIWSESHSVDTKNGLYSVILGSITALTPTILSGPEKYLGIKVGSDPEMTPRRRIVSVASAILSEDADKLDGKHATAFAESVHVHDDRYFTETELNTSDGNPPNQGSNRLSWDNLTDVPAGFADGVDNVNGGGGNTLDQAYDQGGAGAGRSITADAGEVRIDGPDGLIVEGNVGIGIDSATDKLHVGGNIKTEGTLFVPNGTGFFRGLELSEDAVVAGKVGIGNISPTSTLDIKLSGDVDALTVHASTGLGRADLYEQGADNSIALELDDPTSGASKVFLSPTVSSFFNGGNVGIGTADPWSTLTVNDNIPGVLPVVPGLTIGNPTGNAFLNIGKNSYRNVSLLWTDDPGFADLYADGGPLVLQRFGGNVGIGDTSPTNTLDVAGKIGIHDTQLIYLPDQAEFEGTLYLGDGGGSLSHPSTSDGEYNTAMGIGALYSNTTGRCNTASGYQALYSNTTGSGNTASGSSALYSNITGWLNTASGHLALYYNTTGSDNTASGKEALYLNTGGSQNTAIGRGALRSNRTGDHNTAIGEIADVTSDNLQNATAIGYGARVNASNKVVIGNTSVTVIGGYAQWSNWSDGRFKHSVQEDVKGLDFITRLRPVSYQMDLVALNAHLGVKNEAESKYVSNSNKGDIVYSGFIGQEVEAAAREAGYDFSGVVPPQNDKDYYSLRYAEFVVPLVKAVQEQQKMIEQLQNKVAELEQKLGE